jgi:predicted negative regulator of RcsB-dependent stress response
MANENVFEKEYVDQRDKNNLEGVLEQFNVPPAAITYIMKNKRTIQLVLALVVVLVVSWALYDSYRDKKVQNSGTALSSAMSSEGPDRVAALEQVAREYSGTSSALWAEIGLAHELEREGKFQEANSLFNTLLAKTGKDTALRPLLILGIAQSAEALGDYQQAIEQYTVLKTTEGYQSIGYSGHARIMELQGDTEAALAIYEEQLGGLNIATNPGEAGLVEQKIARIKASQ